MDELDHIPPLPWKKGKHAEYSSFTLEVQVCERDKRGVRMVFSQHDFQSEEDAQIARGLKSAGEEQIAFSLLQEALRREAFVETLIQIQQDSTFLASYQEAEEEDQRNIEEKLAAKMVTVLHQTIRKMSPDVVREILTMVLMGAGS